MKMPFGAAPMERGSGGNRRASRRGFTLIEVLAATTVTVIGLLSAFYLVGLSTQVNSDAKSMAQAYEIAQQEIELLRNMPYATLQPVVRAATAAGTPEARFLQASGADDASRPNDVGYPGIVSGLANMRNGRGGLIITNDSVVGDKAKHVTVVVRWTDPGPRERQAVVGTVIAQGGIDPR